MKVEQLNAEDALGLGERSIGSPGAIHLVAAPLDLPPASLCALSVPLSEDERRRAARLLSRREWRRWVAARGWMRRLLSAYLGCNAARIEFTYGCNGKPSLAGPQKADAIAFNMSHSGGLALFAFGRQVSLGVDVESVSRTLPWSGLATRFYSGPEAQHVLGLDEEHRRGGFLAIWTMKEAYSKGLGFGLASPMDSYSVMPAGQSQVNPTPAQVRLGSWIVTSVRPAAGYVGAVAVTAGAIAQERRRVTRVLVGIRVASAGGRTRQQRLERREARRSEPPAEPGCPGPSSSPAPNLTQRCRP